MEIDNLQQCDGMVIISDTIWCKMSKKWLSTYFLFCIRFFYSFFLSKEKINSYTQLTVHTPNWKHAMNNKIFKFWSFEKLKWAKNRYFSICTIERMNAWPNLLYKSAIVEIYLDSWYRSFLWQKIRLFFNCNILL